MRRPHLLGVGAAHTTLLLLLPALHVATWTGVALTPLTIALVALPYLALAAAALHPAPWLTLGAYPLAHLPALIALPALTGPLVYEGALGLCALTAVAAVALTFAALALRRPATPTPPPRWHLRDHALPLAATASALLILAAFLAPILTTPAPVDAPAAQLSILTGTAIAAWFGIRTARGDIADLWLAPRARETWLSVVLAERRASTPSLMLSLLAALLLGSIILAIYGLGT
jgi:hypothetical protein